MKNIINFRALFFTFIAFGFACLFAFQIDKQQVFYVIFFSLAILLIATFAVFRKKLLQGTLILLAFVLGLSSYFISIDKYNKATIYIEQVTVQGQITILNSYSNSQGLVIDNVKINNEKQNFNVYVYITQGSLKLGDKITFTANLNNEKLFRLNRFSSFNYNNNIFYSANIKQTDILNSVSTKLSLRDKIKTHTLNLFLENMQEEEAYVTYGAMFGDTQYISNETYTSFSKSGIIHILSVSGMHVAFVVAILNAILKRTKLSLKTRLIFFTIGLLFYSYLCSFNATVVRSAIMSLALLFAGAFGKQYDMLSAIGFSGLFILVLKPLSIFDIGFQLSFISVIMIALLTKPLTKVFLSMRFGKKLSTLLAVSIGVQIGLFPLLLKYFGELSLSATLANLTAVPLFEAGFILAFILNIVVLIFPFLKFLFLITNLLVKMVLVISSKFASYEFLTLKLNPINDFSIVLFLIALFVISGFFMVKFKSKIIIIALLLLTSFTFGAFNTLPVKYKNLSIFQINHYYSQSQIIASNDKYLLISNFSNPDELKAYLKQAKIAKIDLVIRTDNGENEAEFKQFKKLYPQIITYNYSQAFQNLGFKVKYNIVNSSQKFMFLQVHGMNIMYIDKILESYEISILNAFAFENNINIYLFNQSYTNHISSLNADYYVYNGKLKTPKDLYLNLKNWLFEIKNGKITTIRSID